MHLIQLCMSFIIQEISLVTCCEESFSPLNYSIINAVNLGMFIYIIEQIGQAVSHVADGELTLFI